MKSFWKLLVLLALLAMLESVLQSPHRLFLHQADGTITKPLHPKLGGSKENMWQGVQDIYFRLCNFKCITTFEVQYCWTSTKGGASLLPKPHPAHISLPSPCVKLKAICAGVGFGYGTRDYRVGLTQIRCIYETCVIPILNGSSVIDTVIQKQHDNALKIWPQDYPT